MPLTKDESLLLGRLGFSLFQYAVRTSVYLFFDGIFVVLFFASISVLRRKGVSNRVAAVVFFVTILNLVLFNLFIACLLAGRIIFIRKAFIDTVEVPLLDRALRVNRAVDVEDTIVYWAATFPPLTSDLIVIWRAWVLFYDKRRAIIVPGVLWIGSLAFAVIYDGRLVTRADGASNFIHHSGSVLASLGGIILSVLTNVVTTMMIGYKLCCLNRKHRVVIVKNLGLSKRHSPALKVVALLVETGITFCCFQITYLIMGCTMLTAHPAFAIFESVYVSLAAMYPTLVIVLMEIQQSTTDIYNFDDSDSLQLRRRAVEAHIATEGHLSFARSPETDSSSSILHTNTS